MSTVCRVASRGRSSVVWRRRRVRRQRAVVTRRERPAVPAEPRRDSPATIRGSRSQARTARAPCCCPVRCTQREPPPLFLGPSSWHRLNVRLKPAWARAKGVTCASRGTPARDARPGTTRSCWPPLDRAVAGPLQRSQTLIVSVAGSFDLVEASSTGSASWSSTISKRCEALIPERRSGLAYIVLGRTPTPTATRLCRHA